MSIISEKNVMFRILTHCCTEEMVSGGAFKGSLRLDTTVLANSRITCKQTKSLSFAL